MTRYAEQTTVPADRSLAEIESTLERYGATTFQYGRTEGRAVVAFSMAGREIRFILPLPDKGDVAFTRTPRTGKAREPAAAKREYDQAVRQRWRALLLMVKAKLEAVDLGIVTFEDEFLPHTVLPSGRTVAEEIQPTVTLAYASRSVIPLLIEGGPRG